MDAVIRPLLDPDRPAAGRLLDDAVGTGFWSFGEGPGGLSFVAIVEAAVAGVVLARLTPADEPDAQTVLGPLAARLAAAGEPVLHVHELAVAPTARRGRLASRLLARAETEALALGARASFAFGWLPAGRPEPDAVPFYEAAGYAAGPDIADFFAEGSVASGAHCPYCGDPPCRCAVRPFVKVLAPAAG
jgi:GNAT superfamily N-acetyltransferase